MDFIIINLHLFSFNFNKVDWMCLFFAFKVQSESNEPKIMLDDHQNSFRTIIFVRYVFVVQF